MFKFSFKNMNLFKGKVKGHFRKTATGKIVWVKEHFDARKEAEEAQKKLDKWLEDQLKMSEKHTKELEKVDYYSKKYDLIQERQEKEEKKHKEKKPKTFSGKYVYRDDKEAHVMSDDGITEISLKEHSHINEFDILDTLNKPVDWDFKIDVPLDGFQHLLKGYKADEEGEFTWQEKREIAEKITEYIEQETGGDFQISYLTQDGFSLSSGVKDATIGQMLQLDALKDAYKKTAEKYNEHSTRRGEILLAVNHADEYTDLKEKNMAKWDDIKNMMPKDCPDIPGLNKNYKLYTHQALALAKLAEMDESLVDVDMGGGKSLLLASDCAIQMGMGKAEKPVICMPSNLIESHVEKINDYFEGSIGVFVFDSKTASKKDIKKQLKNLPPNTIILASYSALSNKKGTKESYPNAELLASSGVDMFTLDESHKIKRTSTNANKAITRHFSDCKIKRTASGTLISNNPMDLIGQARFADPSILGSEVAFKNKYTERVKVGKKSMVVWRDGALQDMREHLINRGMISMRRSDWAYRMPPRKEKLHSVDLSPKMRSAYNALLDSILDDPEVQKALASAGEDTDADLPPNVLVKLSHLETLIGAPELTAKDSDRLKEYQEKYGDDKMQMLLIAKATAKGEKSPKVKKVDQILDGHFKDKKNKKVIIMCKTYEAQEYILKHMKHSKKAMATTRTNRNADINEFKKNPDKQVLVAVRAGLKEGYDINEANRIISYDQEWNSGDMEQSYARIFRPGQRAKVNIDVIAGDSTLEMTKYARSVSKQHVNRQITSNFNDGHQLDEIKMNEHNLKTFNHSSQMGPYQERANSLIDSEIKEGELFVEKYGMKEYSKHGKALGKRTVKHKDKPKTVSPKRTGHGWHQILPMDNSSKGRVLENVHGTKFHITGFDSEEGVWTAVKYGDRNQKNPEIFGVDPEHPDDIASFKLHRADEDKSIKTSKAWHKELPKSDKSKGRIVKNIHGTKFHINGYDKEEGVWIAVRLGDKGKKNAEIFGIDPSHPEDKKSFKLHKSFFVNTDLFKAKKKSKYYTPSYVVSVVYPPLGRYASIWSKCARQVFQKKGFKSGYKSEMMGHFNAIHRCVLSQPEIKELNKKKPHDVIGIKKLKDNPPNGLHPLSWSEAVDRVFEDEKFTTQSELDRKMSGLMAHAFGHAKKYAVK